MYVCMYACIYACIYTCRYIFIDTCTHAYTYIYIYVCMYVCMYVCIERENTVACLKHIYLYIYIYTSRDIWGVTCTCTRIRLYVYVFCVRACTCKCSMVTLMFMHVCMHIQPRGSIYTTIMELGPKRPSPLWFWGPNSIMVVYMGPLGNIYIHTCAWYTHTHPMRLLWK